jgi:hypothetical protein
MHKLLLEKFILSLKNKKIITNYKIRVMWQFNKFENQVLLDKPITLEFTSLWVKSYYISFFNQL